MVTISISLAVGVPEPEATCSKNEHRSVDGGPARARWPGDAASGQRQRRGEFCVWVSAIGVVSSRLAK